MKTKQDYLNLLQETVNYYTVEGNKRALNEKGGCFYYTKGKMCAVGRCLVNPKDKDKKLKNFGKGQTDVHALLRRFESNIFKKEYRGFDKEMWAQLQSLHDSDSFWDNFNLSETGVLEVKDIQNYIEKKFADNE